jgi:ABC-type transporter Mla maintaining outer membrane lipid asymmetry permease subunit MlaE
VLAFSAIIVSGACGGLIGFAVMDLGCDDGCTTAAGFVGLGTAVVAAIGTGIVAVLTLRAAAEWRARQPAVNADPVTGGHRLGRNDR